MKAAVGDRIVTASGVVGGAVRDGVVTECPHGDGSPPYRVRWSDTGEETLVYPGGDTYVDAQVEATSGAWAESRRGRALTWDVRITVVEAAGSTTAEATVMNGPPDALRGVGHARKSPDDDEVPLIGDEIAAGRALRRLADRLLAVAEADVSAAVGHKAHLHR
ncbi:dsRBD fold-containing protein [Promicromonospora kroppenstedtii]|uniref:dsRBD fold-containing protein n=1 Tax=Promicromonospora kroppenstedtii TaxID=440482 RepID=UPI0005665076|nr:dsRBD fold-containing protein [Promicromonospora kroppenstedtii]